MNKLLQFRRLACGGCRGRRCRYHLAGLSKGINLIFLLVLIETPISDRDRLVKEQELIDQDDEDVDDANDELFVLDSDGRD